MGTFASQSMSCLTGTNHEIQVPRGLVSDLTVTYKVRPIGAPVDMVVTLMNLVDVDENFRVMFNATCDVPAIQMFHHQAIRCHADKAIVTVLGSPATVEFSLGLVYDDDPDFWREQDEYLEMRYSAGRRRRSGLDVVVEQATHGVQEEEARRIAERVAEAPRRDLPHIMVQDPPMTVQIQGELLGDHQVTSDELGRLADAIVDEYGFHVPIRSKPERPKRVRKPVKVGSLFGGRRNVTKDDES